MGKGNGTSGTGGALPKRPALRYHGGKWILAPWIIEHLPPHHVYVEPYGGAMSVLLRKRPSYCEVYNDLDGEITSLFRVIREQAAALTRALIWTPFSSDEYLLSRERCDDRLEMARRTIIRSLMGFGSNAINRNVKSGFRANSNRSGTTPAHDWASYPLNIRSFARRLRGVVIENKPSVEVIEQHDSDRTLYYLDPPYVWDTRAIDVMHGDHGYAHEMTDEQHAELAEKLHSIKGMAVLSGYHSPLYDKLYRTWNTVQRDAFGDGQCERTEVLWFNNSAWNRLSQGVLPFGKEGGGDA